MFRPPKKASDDLCHGLLIMRRSSMLVRLVELLGRLIGDDMAMKLIEQGWTASDPDDATSDDRREEA